MWKRHHAPYPISCMDSIMHGSIWCIVTFFALHPHRWLLPVTCDWFEMGRTGFHKMFDLMHASYWTNCSAMHRIGHASYWLHHHIVLHTSHSTLYGTSDTHFKSITWYWYESPVCNSYTTWFAINYFHSFFSLKTIVIARTLWNPRKKFLLVNELWLTFCGEI